ncbi:phosphate ABC transporter ATP-binding protein PstB [Candidatus Atelocyanobacterium thalassae]|uniref:Phosphate ABC transporter ATP-binding protein, PhoT family n=2 Tax=Candidatus Atelocyanobacterium thalassae TaxID=713887 RepID=A0A086CIL5_9CHRO|nr:phosphate ABC transporter ATP-binding protein PstB [Candidatus Atelocyanobacterium thalassa]KFF42029.1 MAG: phosphate ABC transporter ATP-binding protein, PhoT family [Candidatus Atelocyanobacterium thalassa isolate SIO64986]BDA39843.1 phosphate import ATP-binding protein PstB [cyanobacterium endosymbiont of Braarudosphaera bigelowii]
MKNNIKIEPILKTENLNVFYGSNLVVRGVDLVIPKGRIVAFIGPSGCGKSTVLRCFNRMNDLIPNAKVSGKITYYGKDIYSKEVNPVDLRSSIGMVFQRPNPFPKSIYENIAFGARINGFKGDMDELVETSLKKATVWDETKDKLHRSGLILSGGQQQRLCIARVIAIKPDVILMDEPCAALDPISTLKIEELINSLKEEHTIVIVTHNMHQASRISDLTAFYNLEITDKGKRTGRLIEYNKTNIIFNNPTMESTKHYISGKFG